MKRIPNEPEFFKKYAHTRVRSRDEICQEVPLDTTTGNHLTPSTSPSYWSLKKNNH